MALRHALLAAASSIHFIASHTRKLLDPAPALTYYVHILCVHVIRRKHPIHPMVTGEVSEFDLNNLPTVPFLPQ